MNTLTLKKHVSGPGPFLIRTSDGKEFKIPHGEFVGFTRHYMMIENEEGALDIVDPLHVVSVRPVARKRSKAV